MQSHIQPMPHNIDIDIARARREFVYLLNSFIGGKQENTRTVVCF